VGATCAVPARSCKLEIRRSTRIDPAAISFVLFLLVFVGIGAASVLRSRGTTDDYYMASKSVAPWLSGLSAVATNNSGYMFIGMIGMTYTSGWSSIWLMIGWILGDLTGSLMVLRHLRTASDQANVHSYPQLLAKWQGTNFVRLQRLAALMIVLFLGTYAAAQLKAGSKALNVVFEWDLATGAIIGAVIVLVYSIVGGIRASIWTDAAQSFVMLGAMFLLAILGIDNAGGWRETWTALHQVGPDYMHWFEGTGIEAIFVVVGWLFAGLAVLGQPHVVIRFMSFDDASHVNRVRAWYYSWFTLFYGATIIVGLLTRLYLPDTEAFDAEIALPLMAMEMFPGWFVGIILAGLFAATISTADSLVLACSSAAVADLRRSGTVGLHGAKKATAAVVVLALVIALVDNQTLNQTVFRLVLISWGLLGAAFVPLILIYTRGGRPSEGQALTTMLAGVAIFGSWRMLGFSEAIYEALPAIVGALSLYAIMARLGILASRTPPDDAS